MSLSQGSLQPLKKPLSGLFGLFLGFFVLGHCTIPFAPFFELDFALNELLILARPIVYASTFGAREFYELIL
jgi:hypothetical protein